MDRNDVLEVLVVVAGVTFPVWWFRFLVGYAHVDLHDYFQEGSLMWGLVHTNFWLVTIPLGVLIGVLEKWAREEQLLRRGLEEWREWRRGRGPARPPDPTHPSRPPGRGGLQGGEGPPASRPFYYCQPSTGRSDVGSDCPLVPRPATPDDSLNKGPAHLLGRQRRGSDVFRSRGPRHRVAPAPAHFSPRARCRVGMARGSLSTPLQSTN